MAKRMTDTDKWKKRFVRELSPQHKLLWFYILDDCNHAGIWEVDLEVASIRVGFDLSHDNLPSSFGQKVISFDDGDKWSIPDFIDFQYGELNPNSNVHKSVIQLLERYNLEGYVKGSQTLTDTAQDKDKVKDKVKVKRFVKPTVYDIEEYCIGRNNSVDSQKFYDYYSSNGWRVGKNPMKDWKACVRTWEKNTSQQQKVSQPKQVLTAWEQARTQINNG